MAPGTACSHLLAVNTVKHEECEECIKTGDSWVHLRTCQTCGTTLCCDSSISRHATRHAQATGHPVVASAEPGENKGNKGVSTLFPEIKGSVPK
ncbi:MAG: UBP-type zinc finger domain-containing protein [Gammaproteobacteria bacterium]